jgi:titin
LDRLVIVYYLSNESGAPLTGYLLEKRTRIQRKWTRAYHEIISTTEYCMRELNQGTEYLFRVSVINQAGASEPSPASVGVIARAPIRVAFQLRYIHVRDATDNSMEIEWTKPECNGGSRVTGYIVEMAKTNAEWERITLTHRTGRIQIASRLEESSVATGPCRDQSTH